MFSSTLISLFLFFAIPNLVLGKFWINFYQTEFETGKSTEDNGEVTLMYDLDEQDQVLDTAFPPDEVLDKAKTERSNSKRSNSWRSNSLVRGLERVLSNGKGSPKKADSSEAKKKSLKSSKLSESSKNKQGMALPQSFLNKFDTLRQSYAMVRSHDEGLAKMFMELLNDFRALKKKKEENSTDLSEGPLQRLMVKSVYYLAVKWKISKEQIDLKPKDQKKGNLMIMKNLLKELAKIWPKMNEDEEEEESAEMEGSREKKEAENSKGKKEKKEKQKKEKSDKKREEEEKKRKKEREERQKRRTRVLQLIMETACQSNNNDGVAINLAKGKRGGLDGPRRRKKRGLMGLAAAIIGAAILLSLFSCFMSKMWRSSRYTDYTVQPADHNRLEQVKIKVVYGPPGSGDIVESSVIVGPREYSLSSEYGARGRNEYKMRRRGASVDIVHFNGIVIHSTIADAEHTLKQMYKAGWNKPAEWFETPQKSVDFTYQFVCRLNKPEIGQYCPNEGEWPGKFQDFNRYEVQKELPYRRSVFDPEYRMAVKLKKKHQHHCGHHSCGNNCEYQNGHYEGQYYGQGNGTHLDHHDRNTNWPADGHSHQQMQPEWSSSTHRHDDHDDYDYGSDSPGGIIEGGRPYIPGLPRNYRGTIYR